MARRKGWTSPTGITGGHETHWKDWKRSKLKKEARLSRVKFPATIKGEGRKRKTVVTRRWWGMDTSFFEGK